MSNRELKLHLEDRIPDMIKILSKGKDMEVRKSKDGITIAEINRKLVKKQEQS